MAVSSEELTREGVLVLDEVSMRGSAVVEKSPMDSNVSTLWGNEAGLAVLSMGGSVNAWRAHGIASELMSKISSERVVVVDELPLRNCAIDADLDEDWEVDYSLVRQLPSSAVMQRQQTAEGAVHAAGNRCQQLESGVVVGGVAAAALTACQLRSVPAVLYVGLSREAPDSIARMHAHEDPVYPLAALLRAELEHAGFASSAKKPNAAQSLLPSAGLFNLYL